MGFHFCFGETSWKPLFVINLSIRLWKIAGPLSRRLANNVVDICGSPQGSSSPVLEKHSIFRWRILSSPSTHSSVEVRVKVLKRWALQLNQTKCAEPASLWNLDLKQSKKILRTLELILSELCPATKSPACFGACPFQAWFSILSFTSGALSWPNGKVPFHISYPELVSVTCKNILTIPMI